MTKATARASSDIALVKYWGKKDEILRLPENGSISIVLDGLDTVTTVEFSKDYNQDTVIIEGESDPQESDRVIKHLDRIRQFAKSNIKARVESKNSFPKATGLSSSGSGFAALTLAATKALGLNLSEKELSILSRQGSGTACRCACGGFVEWKDGSTSDTSYSETIYPKEHWDIRDVVAVVDEGRKRVSSTQGHTTAQSSIAFEARQLRIKDKINNVKKYINDKDFASLGDLAEKECLEFHSILLTSEPPLIAWYPGTIEVMHEVQRMREEGIEAYFTISTGFNIHVLTLPQYQDQVHNRISTLPLVKKTLLTKVGDKPNIINNHLF